MRSALDHIVLLGKQTPERLPHDLAVKVPQRGLDCAASEREALHPGYGGERRGDLPRVKEDLADHLRRKRASQHLNILLDCFRKIPVRGKCDAFAQTNASFRIDDLHDDRLAEFKRRLRRHERLFEGDAHTMQNHAAHVEAFRVDSLDGGTVDLADTLPRQAFHDENLLGTIKLREHVFELAVDGGDEFAVTRARGGERLRGMPSYLRFYHLATEACCLHRGKPVKSLVTIAASGGLARALDERHGTPSPHGVGGTKHVGVRHAGNRHELVGNLCGIDVFSTRDEHVGGALLHVNLALVESRHIAGEEEAVRGEGSARVQVVRQHARPAHRQAAETAPVGLDDTRLVAG